jgi:chromosome segregation ATPase
LQCFTRIEFSLTWSREARRVEAAPLPGIQAKMATLNQEDLADDRDVASPPSTEPAPSGLRRRAGDALASHRKQIDRLENELSDRLEQLVTQIAEGVASAEGVRAATNSQDLRVAELQSQVDRLRLELAARQKAHDEVVVQLDQSLLHNTRLEGQLAELQETIDQFQSKQDAPGAELAAAREQLADAEARLIAARQQQDELQLELSARERTGQLESAAAVDERVREELDGLRRQRDHLLDKLAEIENATAETSRTGVDLSKYEDLKRRFELAVEDVRSLKQSNTDLEEKLSKAARGGATSHQESSGLDWESQKRRLLAALEADVSPGEEAAADRQTIEGTIRITDQIVERKDQEIARLNRLLEERPAAGSRAAVAVDSALDKDEVIRQEREKLKALQDEWRDKIGKAEIEISVERAKIARQRTEVDDKMRQCQERQQADSPAAGEGEPAKNTRGRWLSKLGLKGIDES